MAASVHDSSAASMSGGRGLASLFSSDMGTEPNPLVLKQPAANISKLYRNAAQQQ